MKCEYCGGTLSLEEEVCPHCGRINIHAQQHIRDMEHYKGEFESAKKGVYSVTKKYTEVTVRIIIIAVLVVLMAIMLFVASNIYSIRRNLLENDAKRNQEEYSAIIDKYIEEEDFKRLSLFCEEHKIGGYHREYEQYAPVIRASSSYLSCVDSIMSFISSDPEADHERMVESISDNLEYFYSHCNWDDYTYYDNADREENVKALEIMNNNINLMLQTYCHLTKEEAEGLKNMSKAKRSVLIEEKVGNVE